MARLHYNELRWLTPDAQEAAARFLESLRAAGLTPHVAETYRPQETQDAIFAASTVPGGPVLTKTNRSWHTVGRALDVNIAPADYDSIVKFTQIANGLGFHTIHDPAEWDAARAAGEKPDLWDWHHVEYRAGRTWKEAKTEFDKLLRRGPTAPQTLPQILSSVLMLGALASAFNTGNGTSQTT